MTSLVTVTFFLHQPSDHFVAGVARRSGTSEWADIFWPLISWRSGTPSGQTTEAQAESSISEMIQRHADPDHSPQLNSFKSELGREGDLWSFLALHFVLFFWRPCRSREPRHAPRCLRCACNSSSHARETQTAVAFEKGEVLMAGWKAASWSDFWRKRWRWIRSRLCCFCLQYGNKLNGTAKLNIREIQPGRQRKGGHPEVKWRKKHNGTRGTFIDPTLYLPSFSPIKHTSSASSLVKVQRSCPLRLEDDRYLPLRSDIAVAWLYRDLKEGGWTVTDIQPGSLTLFLKLLEFVFILLFQGFDVQSGFSGDATVPCYCWCRTDASPAVTI